MHFVQVDKDKAADLATYLRARDEICQPGAHCQVLFWTDDTPARMPLFTGTDQVSQVDTRGAWFAADDK